VVHTSCSTYSWRDSGVQELVDSQPYWGVHELVYVQVTHYYGNHDLLYKEVA
jgi:hypothetical protein